MNAPSQTSAIHVRVEALRQIAVALASTAEYLGREAMAGTPVAPVALEVVAIETRDLDRHLTDLLDEPCPGIDSQIVGRIEDAVLHLQAFLATVHGAQQKPSAA